MILVPFLVGISMHWTRLTFSINYWYRFWGPDGSFTLMLVYPANKIVPVNVDTIIDGIVSISSSRSTFSSICGQGC